LKQGEDLKFRSRAIRLSNGILLDSLSTKFVRNLEEESENKQILAFRLRFKNIYVGNHKVSICLSPVNSNLSRPGYKNLLSLAGPVFIESIFV
jgi:hypothetical protein